METLEILQKARDWLDDPKHWTKGAYGASPGNRKQYHAGYAKGVGRTCLIGAIEHVTKTAVDHQVASAIGDCLPNRTYYGNGSIIEFNDQESTTHDDVLHVLDCAIDKALAKAQL